MDNSFRFHYAHANNTASAPYVMPDWSSTGFCDATRDCRDNPFYLDTQTEDESENKNRICERYADYYFNKVNWASWCDDYPPRAVGDLP